MIYSVQNFINDKGQRIEAHAEHNSMLPVFSRFIGRAMGKFATPAGPMQQEYEFLIEAKSVTEAYEKFSESARAAGEAFQKRIEDLAMRQRLTGGG